MHKYLLPAVFALLTMPLSGVVAATPTNAEANKLRAAAEPFEALTEQAFDASNATLDKDIKSVEKAAAQVRALLPSKDALDLDGRLADVKKARAAGNRADLAIAAVEGYRTLVSAAGNSKIPAAVSMLDYAGFRATADLKAKPVRWEDVTDAAAFARQQWTGIAANVKPAGLKAAVEKAIGNMESAAAKHDAKLAASASQTELDLVDKLEGYFGGL